MRALLKGNAINSFVAVPRGISRTNPVSTPTSIAKEGAREVGDRTRRPERMVGACGACLSMMYTSARVINVILAS